MPAKKILLTALLMLSCLSAQADTVWRSGPQQTHLIELYTSEGCSSCPPADKWLSALTDHPDLWRAFVPVALHVDYWDYIGWRDPFAMPQHGVRQKTFRKKGNSRATYTPGFFLNGKEWRARQAPSPARKKTGILALFDTEEGLTLEFSAEKIKASESIRAHIVLLGFDLESEVTRGENHGRRLNHDFVVLDHQIVDNNKRSDAKTLQWQASKPDRNQQTAKRYALAAWIENPKTMNVIQSVGGWW